MSTGMNWERRYEDDNNEYDWYFESSLACSFVEPLTQGFDDEILYVGCGTSSLGEELYRKGRRFVTNIDTSKNAIRTMSARYSHLTDMQFVDMDASKMPKDLTGAFQVVVDKALMDCMSCEPKKEKLHRFLSEVRRVLRVGGKFCCISHGVPETRVPLLSSAFGVSPAKVRVSTVPKPHIPSMEEGASGSYFVYTVVKTATDGQ